MQGSPDVPQERIDAVHRGYRTLENYLSATKFVASNDHFTVADLAIFAWMESMSQVFTTEKYPKINAWLNEMRKLPYYEEANKKGADLHAKIFRESLEKNKQKK